MSRIGKVPVSIPKGVDVQLGPEGRVGVKGPNGTLQLDTKGHVDVKRDGDAIVVERHSDHRQDRAYHGLYQRLIGNMIQGASEGFTKNLELVGVGYRAQMEGKALVLNLGYSHPIRFEPPEGITIKTPSQTQVSIAGADKQAVGQVAADLRALRPPEPYKGKGVRYEGEHIRRKVGKTGAV